MLDYGKGVVLCCSKMSNKREIEENKDQCKLKIYIENPLNPRKKSQIEIVGDFSLCSILQIIEYETKNSRKALTPQKVTYLIKIGI